MEKKTQGLAHALIRVAAYIRRAGLRQKIEHLSYELLEQVYLGRPRKIIQTAHTVKAFVTLGKNLLAIEPVNAKILVRELDYLINAANEIAGSVPLPDLETFFAGLDPVRADGRLRRPTSNGASKPDPVPSAGADHGASKPDALVGKIRQDRVLEKIRQSETLHGGQGGKVQLKDLIAEFPGTSERTIRYDLKKLAEEGKIERQGTGGPSNFYVLKHIEI